MIIPFPAVETFLSLLLYSADQLDHGQYRIAGESLEAAHLRLRRIGHIERYRQVDEFVGHALLAYRKGDYRGARNVLLAAVEIFSGESVPTSYDGSASDLRD
jgi:hypothetical protein